MIVLDTNVISALMENRPEAAVRAWLDRQPSQSIWTTSITVVESRFGIEIMPTGRRRDVFSAAFSRILHEDLDGRVLPFGAADAEQTALLMARRRASGRTGEFRDGMIAGIVKARKATLATRNTRHFEDAGIDLIDPWRG